MNIVRGVLPGLVGFLISAMCRFTKGESTEIKIAPPPFVFGIVWPILYLIIGYAWVTEYKNKYVDIVFIINLVFSGLWLYTFNCKNNKRLALYLILVLIASSLMMIQACTKLPNRIILCLYSTWLIFAMVMNTQFVINDNK